MSDSHPAPRNLARQTWFIILLHKPQVCLCPKGAHCLGMKHCPLHTGTAK